MKAGTTASLLMLALFMTGNALAADLSISGDARVRYRYLDAYNFNEADDSVSAADSRFRLQVDGKTDGGLYAIGRAVLSGDYDNDDIAQEGDDSSLWVDKAYVGIPFAGQFRIELGRYRETLTDFIMEDFGITGIRGMYTGDLVNIKLMYHLDSEGDEYLERQQDLFEENDEESYGLQVELKPIQACTIGATWLQTANAQSEVEPEGYLSSLYAKTERTGLNAAAEIAFTDKIEESDDGAMGGYFQLSYLSGPIDCSIQTGLTKDGFLPDSDWGYFMLGGGEAIEVMDIGEGGDWKWFGIQSKYGVTKRLNLTGNCVWANIDAADNGDTGDLSLLEISGGFVYSIMENIELSWGLGCLYPDHDRDEQSDHKALGTFIQFEARF